MPAKKCYKLFGIIGSPIKQSLSPDMHNAAFKKLKIRAAYLPFLIAKGKLKEAISSLRESGISGFNVTVPFKTECMKYLDEVDKTARIIGAVNTVVVRGKRFIGYNTDYAGFIRSIKEDIGFKPKGKNIFIIGAGGASRAIVYSLAKEGANAIIVNDVMRNRSKKLADSLKRFFPNVKISACGKEDIAEKIKGCRLLVNCTPLGMESHDPMPIPAKLLHKGLAVYDIIYNPLRTDLVKTAQRKNIKAAGGLGMLLYQGAIAFRLWTKKNPPVHVMRKALRDNLNI